VSRLRRPRGLQIEIVLNLVAVVTAGLVTIAVICVGLAARTVEREALERLHLTARHLQRSAASRVGRLSDLGALARTLDARTGSGSWRVVDPEGREIWRGPSSRSEEEEDLGDLAREAGSRGVAIRGGLISYADLRLALPVRTARGEEAILIGTITEQDLWGRVRPLVGAAAWVLVITATVFISFGAYLLRRRIVRPVRDIARASAEIAKGRFSTRVDIPGEHELADLGRHFNQMAQSLEQQRNALVSAERSVARNERLASVGRLAAGVAHEVGNPVAAILGFGEVALRDSKLSDRTRGAVDSVKGEALRIRALIWELLDLARADQIELADHDLGALLEAVVERIRSQPGHGAVEIRLALPVGLPCVRTDVRRVEQALVNLLDNAMHAVAGINGGRIEIGGRVAILESTRGGSGGIEAVAVDVLDNGPGIDPEDLGRVFEPFFTTKDPGIGTGLGLWNAHRWAELLGGRLEVESGEGRTRFSLLLPAADSAGCDGPSPSVDRG
jgi:signal transduction histidine kinase